MFTCAVSRPIYLKQVFYVVFGIFVFMSRIGNNETTEFDFMKIFVIDIQIILVSIMSLQPLDNDYDDEKWLQEQKQLQEIQSNYCREFMDSIHLQFVFLSREKHITHITSIQEPLHVCDVSNQCVLSEERILALLANIKKQYNGKKFALHHISSFLVDLEPEHIQQFSTSTCSEESPFLRHYSIMQSINIPQSIFIFHNVNTIYFFLHEIPCSHQHTLRPILKKKSNGLSGNSSQGLKKTKRVRIQHDTTYQAPKEEFVLRHYSSQRGTRKRRP